MIAPYLPVHRRHMNIGADLGRGVQVSEATRSQHFEQTSSITNTENLPSTGRPFSETQSGKSANIKTRTTKRTATTTTTTTHKTGKLAQSRDERCWPREWRLSHGRSHRLPPLAGQSGLTGHGNSSPRRLDRSQPARPADQISQPGCLAKLAPNMNAKVPDSNVNLAQVSVTRLEATKATSASNRTNRNPICTSAPFGDANRGDDNSVGAPVTSGESLSVYPKVIHFGSFRST